MELYQHSHHTPSWRGAQLKKAQGQLYLLQILFYESNNAEHAPQDTEQSSVFLNSS
jgi:hypothetical protein